MPKLSAGLLLYRTGHSGVEVLLVHPGGPFWAKKDDAAWSIPKGEYERDEDALAAARREFAEELGLDAPRGPAVDLGEVPQPGGKRVRAWAVEGDLDVAEASSNTFDIEWPKGSGTMRTYPEVDRAAWYPLAEARRKLHKGQVPFVDLLVAGLREAGISVEET
jgi:predicted NUDIX family NTP pyrophosphohydrolase